MGISKELEAKRPKIFKIYEDYRQLISLRQQVQNTLNEIKKEADAKESFLTILAAYNVASLVQGRSGLAFDSLDVNGNEITLKGKVKMNSKSEGFLKYLRLVQQLGDDKFVLVRQDFDPVKETFLITLKVRNES